MIKFEASPPIRTHIRFEISMMNVEFIANRICFVRQTTNAREDENKNHRNLRKSAKYELRIKRVEQLYK